LCCAEQQYNTNFKCQLRCGAANSTLYRPSKCGPCPTDGPQGNKRRNIAVQTEPHQFDTPGLLQCNHSIKPKMLNVGCYVENPLTSLQAPRSAASFQQTKQRGVWGETIQNTQGPTDQRIESSRRYKFYRRHRVTALPLCLHYNKWCQHQTRMPHAL
jgi:hypothetical protein